MSTNTKHLDDPRLILASISGHVPAYNLEVFVDWNEIAFMYGERFREGKLLLHTSNNENFFLVVSSDVQEPGRVIAECALKETKTNLFHCADNDTQIKDFATSDFSLATCLKVCDPVFLFENGVVVLNTEQISSLPRVGNPGDFLSDEEKTEMFTTLKEYFQ